MGAATQLTLTQSQITAQLPVHFVTSHKQRQLGPVWSHLEHHKHKQDEVAIQRRTSLREEEGWGREDQEEISRQSASDRGEVSQGKDWWPGQKEVSGSLWFDCWPILLSHQEEDQFETRRCAFLFCQQCDSPYLRHHGIPLSGAPWRRFLPVHRVLRRVRLRRVVSRVKEHLSKYGFRGLSSGWSGDPSL